MRKKLLFLSLLLAIVALSGCSVYVREHYHTRYYPEEHHNYHESYYSVDYDYGHYHCN